MRFVGSLLALLVGVLLIFFSLWILVRAMSLLGLIELFGVPETTFHWVNGTFAVVGGLATWLDARAVAVWSLSLKPLPNDHPCRQEVVELARNLKVWVPNDVYVFASPEINSFSLGFHQRFGLVALSQGLVDLPDPELREHIVRQILFKLSDPLQSIFLLLRAMVLVFTLLPARMMVFMLGTSLRTSDEGTPTDGPESIMTWTLEWLILPLPTVFLNWLARGIERRADRLSGLTAGDFKEALLKLAKMPAIEETREIFTLPFKFGRQKSSWNFYHRSYRVRASAL